MVIDLDQVPTSRTSTGGSSDFSTSIADLMKKRKVPTFFDQSTSADEGAKKSKNDVPAEGTKSIGVAPSKGISADTKEVGNKPPVVPKEAAPLIKGVAITQEETAPLIEGASLRRLSRGPAERPIEAAAQPSKVGDPALRANAPALTAPNSAIDLIKSWVNPEYRVVEDTLSRERIIDLATQHITSVSIVSFTPLSSNVVFAF